MKQQQVGFDIRNDEHVGYRRLAVKVLMVAMRDARLTKVSLDGFYRVSTTSADRSSARRFLTEDSDLLRLWCGWSELNAATLAEACQERLQVQQPWRRTT